MSLEYYTDRRNLARERIVDGQRGKHISRQDILAEHMNKAQNKFLDKELNVVASQHDVVIKVMRHQTNGFVRVQRQGVGGLFLHGMYKKLAKDHFKAVDRIIAKGGVKPRHVSIHEPEVVPELEASPELEEGEFFNPIAVIPSKVKRPSPSHESTAHLLISVLKPAESTSSSEKRRKRSKPRRENNAKISTDDILGEAVIQAINDVNSVPKPELKQVNSPRRKYGVYRHLRQPNFMQELEAAAAAETCDYHNIKKYPTPKSSSSSLNQDVAPWKKVSGGTSAPSSMRWSGAGLFPSGKSSMRVSPVQEVPLSPIPVTPTPHPESSMSHHFMSVQEAVPNPSADLSQEKALDHHTPSSVTLPQLAHPITVSKPAFQRMRKPRRPAPRRAGGPSGSHLKLLFREEELDTFKKLKNRLFLERKRMQHRISAQQCSGNLKEWLDRNPPIKSYDIENIEALMKSLKPEDRPPSSSSIES